MAGTQELGESQKQTGERMRRTDEKSERMGRHLDGIQQNLGDVAKETLFEYLYSTKKPSTLSFNDVIHYMVGC